MQKDNPHSLNFSSQHPRLLNNSNTLCATLHKAIENWLKKNKLGQLAAGNEHQSVGSKMFRLPIHRSCDCYFSYPSNGALYFVKFLFKYSPCLSFLPQLWLPELRLFNHYHCYHCFFVMRNQV